jgi:uncharacterized protein involved in response to NO
MASKPIEIRIAQPRRAAGADDEPTFPPYKGPAFLSYGFRPFFFAGALFAGFAVPIWVLLYAGIAVPGFSIRRANGTCTKCCSGSFLRLSPVF